MESVDKLRELPVFGAVSVDGDLNATNQRMVCATKEEVLEIADAIEAEIAERYLALQLDADGVPIHVGDKLNYTDPFGNVFLCTVQPLLPHNPKCYRHVKPRTLEDVLFEFGEEFEGEMDEIAPIIAKYADEIRELLGGDAE